MIMTVLSMIMVVRLMVMTVLLGTVMVRLLMMTVLTVIMTVLTVIVTVLGLVIVLVRVDRELRRRDAGTQNLLGVDVRVAERQPAERGPEIGQRQASVEQRAERHVARQPGEAIEIRHLHSCPSSFRLQYRASPSTM